MREDAEKPLSTSGDRTAVARGDDMRAALLNAALEAFAKQGYHAMSVRELTRSLDVSHNIVHHHFRSKKELWCAAIEYGLADARSEVVGMVDAAARDADADPEEAIRRMIKEAVLLYARFPSLARIINHESAQGGERLEYLFEHYIGPTARALQRFLKSLHKKKGLRKIDPKVVALYVVSGVPALFTHSALAHRLGGLDASSPAALNAYAESIADLVALGLVESA